MALNDEEGLNNLQLTQWKFAQLQSTISLEQCRCVHSRGGIDMFLNKRTPMAMHQGRNQSEARVKCQPTWQPLRGGLAIRMSLQIGIDVANAWNHSMTTFNFCSTLYLSPAEEARINSPRWGVEASAWSIESAMPCNLQIDLSARDANLALLNYFGLSIGIT